MSTPVSNRGASLTAAESGRLLELEEVIEHGLATFLAVGQALVEIRESRLYRKTHETFEDYCQDKWDFTGRRARQLMTAAQIGTIVPVGNEGQARELARLTSEQEIESVWEELRAEHGEKLTARLIREAVQARLAPISSPEWPGSPRWRKLQEKLDSDEAKQNPRLARLLVLEMQIENADYRAATGYWDCGAYLQELDRRRPAADGKQRSPSALVKFANTFVESGLKNPERAGDCIRLHRAYPTRAGFQLAIEVHGKDAELGLWRYLLTVADFGGAS